MMWRGAVDWPAFHGGASMLIAGGVDAKFMSRKFTGLDTETRRRAVAEAAKLFAGIGGPFAKNPTDAFAHLSKCLNCRESGETARGRFMQAVQTELEKFERQENAFLRNDRRERAARLAVLVEDDRDILSH